MDFSRLKQNFLKRVDPTRGLETLLDHLPDVYVWVKDAEGRFVFFNRAFIALLGVRDERDILGRRDRDFFPSDLCESYARDDRAVIESGKPLVDKVELVRNKDGSIDWFHTTKVPVFDRAGRIFAVAGMTRDLKKMSSTSGRFLFMAPVIEIIMRDYANPPSIATLASKVGLSVSQFERQFRRKFQTTPLRYINRIRINAACQLLVGSDLPLCDVALQAGFYDQSHFTHHFVRQKGMTPSRYRRTYAAPPP